MPKSDDELREMFARGRESDRDAAPSFEATWAAAGRRPRGTRWPVALAAAAMLAVAGGWFAWSGAPSPTAGYVAETSPVPDLPVHESDSATLDAELAELAAWAPASLGAPTDFLLEDDGVLAGGLPTVDLNNSVLDVGDLSTEL